MFVMAQQTITVKFTGRAWDLSYFKLDEVRVTNVTRGWEQTLYYPDTTLVLHCSDGIEETTIGNNLTTNFPNPFHGSTEATLTLNEASQTEIQVVGIDGKLIAETSSYLTQGKHNIKVDLAEAGMAILHVRTSTQSHALKMMSLGGNANSVSVCTVAEQKAKPNTSKSGRSDNVGEFVRGDVMSYTGIVRDCNGTELESIYTSTYAQTSSNDLIFDFGASYSEPTVEYDYNCVVIEGTQARFLVKITNSGWLPITNYGVCYSFSTTSPSIGNNTGCVIVDGLCTGEFWVYVPISGLANTTYYVKTFATNAKGTAYCNGLWSFKINSAYPDVTTTAVTSYGSNWATMGGNVTSDNGVPVTERGVIWCQGTYITPTIGGTNCTTVVMGSGTGSFSQTVNNLSKYTTYRVRAYAKNENGRIEYGEIKTFTTLDNSSPTVTITDITYGDTYANCFCNVTSASGVTARGICWSTSPYPTLDDSHTSDGTGTGNFTSSLTELSRLQTYYVRAYATNSVGTSYSEQKTFHTCLRGGLGPIYSLSPTRRVNFSKGNLLYRASTDTWMFATGQTTYMGVQNENISPTYNLGIDLFGWGTGNNPTNSSMYYSDYSTYSEWGYNTISNGHSGLLWLTPTSDEWNYLLFERTTASGIRFAKANVDGVNGIIILPDKWKASYYTLNSVNNISANYSVNIITSANWTSKLEAHGVVFLPAGGSRIGNSVESAYVGIRGEYWSSTPNASNTAYGLSFDENNLRISSTFYRHAGLSVRLVSGGSLIIDTDY